MEREYIWKKEDNNLNGCLIDGYPIAASYSRGRCIHAQTLSEGAETSEPLGKGEYKHLILREDEIGQYWESVEEFFERIEHDKDILSGKIKVEPGYKALKMDNGYRKELVLQEDGSWLEVKSMGKIEALKEHIEEEIAELNKLNGNSNLCLFDKEELFKDIGHKAGTERVEESYSKVVKTKAGTIVDKDGNKIIF
jgi:hypothetical protein